MLKRIAVFVVFSASVFAQVQPPLTDQRIIELTRAGVTQDKINRIIATAPSVSFDLTPAAEQQMMQAGVTEATIRAMAARESGRQPQALPGAAATYPKQRQSSESEPIYGIRLGTISASVGAGIVAPNGAHPSFTGDLLFGLHRYFGLFGEAAYATNGYHWQVPGCFGPLCGGDIYGNGKYFGGGAEVIGSNHSHLVPFGKFGMVHVRNNLSATNGYGVTTSGAEGVSALLYGGGARFYFSHRFGVHLDISGLYGVGTNGGGNALVVTVGAFLQPRR